MGVVQTGSEGMPALVIMNRKKTSVSVHRVLFNPSPVPTPTKPAQSCVCVGGACLGVLVYAVATDGEAVNLQQVFLGRPVFELHAIRANVFLLCVVRCGEELI